MISERERERERERDPPFNALKIESRVNYTTWVRVTCHTIQGLKYYP
jgi:hypothetical protein